MGNNEFENLLLNNNNFLFKKKLMWEISEDKLDELGENERNKILNWNYDDSKWDESNKIWDKFLKDNLLYFKK